MCITNFTVGLILGRFGIFHASFLLPSVIASIILEEISLEKDLFVRTSNTKKLLGMFLSCIVLVRILRMGEKIQAVCCFPSPHMFSSCADIFNPVSVQFMNWPKGDISTVVDKTNGYLIAGQF